MILITYTTEYREGGAQLERAAFTMAREKRREHPDVAVACRRVESKRDFVEALHGSGAPIDELHFVGHSGMYGPMFGTRELPEQFSPHEWRELDIPFADGAAAYFHACRTARWFASFFADTFGVPTYGYHWYTSFSTHPDVFRWPGLSSDEAPLYLAGCPGKKSHGLVGSLAKYAGLTELESMKRFEPAAERRAGSYDPVADQYAAVFADIRVRADEWAWLGEHLPADRPRVLDIGCGNGALLRQLAERIEAGRGVDISERMVELARDESAEIDHLSFEKVDGPELPFADDSFDVVTSFLSFRYLDWDPILAEIVRVLRPGGRFLVVDMVTWGLEIGEVGDLVASKWRAWKTRREHPEFAAHLEALVDSPAWAEMLRHNPIRSQHEFQWYLESRFPGRDMEVLNVGWKSRVVAFDSGPIHRDWIPPQSYP